MYCCAHKTTTLNSIQHTVPPLYPIPTALTRCAQARRRHQRRRHRPEHHRRGHGVSNRVNGVGRSVSFRSVRTLTYRVSNVKMPWFKSDRNDIVLLFERDEHFLMSSNSRWTRLFLLCPWKNNEIALWSGLFVSEIEANWSKSLFPNYSRWRN